MRLSGTKTGSINQYRGLGDQLWDLGGARPSLDLNFAHSKSLVDATTGTNLIDFTRASSGTYVGSDRLIKTAVTNLVTYSEAFNQWTQTNVDLNPDQVVAPDGTLTADEVLSTSGVTGNHRVVYAYTFSNAGDKTISVYVKNKDAEAIRINLYNATDGNVALADIDLSDFSVSSGSATVSPVGNGWHRISLSGSYSAVYSQFFIQLVKGGNNNFTGDGTGVYLWGAQLERSSTVGEYVKTTSTINSAPRFDHDPTTGESLGLLVEESRTNLLLQSEDFSTTWTTINATVTTNQIASPDGTVTADLISDDGSTPARVRPQVTVVAGQTYTASIYLKAGSQNTVFWREDNEDSLQVEVDLTTGQITSGTGTINPVGDGWYRVSFSGSVSSTGFWPEVRLTSPGTIYAWGAQLEEGSFPTSYIPTEGSTVTRAADVASISGSNFSSWMTSFGENTFFVEARNPRTDNGLFVEGGANAVQGISIGANNDADRVRVLVRHGPSRIDTGNSAGALFGDDNIKIAATTSADGSFVYVGGALQAQEGTPNQSDWSGLQLNIGSRYNGTLQSCCTISRITFWSQKLSETTLQGITQ